MKKLLKIVPILTLLLITIPFSSVQAQAQSQDSIVHILLFWMDGCPHCHEVLDNVLPPLEEKYGPRLQITLVEIITQEDINGLFAVGAAYGFPKEQIGVPFLIIGDQVLIGSDQITTGLPGLIKTYLAQGGVSLQLKPELLAFIQPEPDSEEACSPVESCNTPPTDGVPSVTDTPNKIQNPIVPPTATLINEFSEEIRENGFALAVVIMVLMVGALTYSLIAVGTGKSFSLPIWANWFIPLLIIIGLGVAAYLSYVETQLVDAVCGPVGDCNAVQSSPYARLFGVLPIGILGLLGYIALLGAWLAQLLLPSWKQLASKAFWIMTVFAVTFSIYLTYLEPFVIRAVCSWCLSSAVIVTLLLLLGTPSAAHQKSTLNKE